jgi:hypothetical protein
VRRAPDRAHATVACLKIIERRDVTDYREPSQARSNLHLEIEVPEVGTSEHGGEHLLRASSRSNLTLRPVVKETGLAKEHDRRNS